MASAELIDTFCLSGAVVIITGLYLLYKESIREAREALAEKLMKYGLNAVNPKYMRKHLDAISPIPSEQRERRKLAQTLAKEHYSIKDIEKIIEATFNE